MSSKKSDINYIVGHEYPFTVVNIYYDFCELRDESNFSVYLQHTNKLRLVRGQKIKCKVLANSEKRPKIEIVQPKDANSQKSVKANDVDNILNEYSTNWNTRDFTRLLLMIETDSSFEDECRTWIASLNNTGSDLETVKTDCTHFLEQSPFLSLCNPTEREFYQDRLTILIELLNYYIIANRMLTEDNGNSFIDGIFDKLRSSAYVYHPQKNFNIMSCLFLANHQLMEDRMEKLFDIIRQWDVEIWSKEPFNSTLTKIIGLYINENIWSVDRIKDNKALVGNLVQALTIQLLLMKAAEKTDTPEYRLCITRLCYIATYVFNISQQQLLDLALSNLLGEYPSVPYYTLKETKERVVPFRLTGMQPRSLETINCFIHGRGKLVVSEKGFSLYTGQEEVCKPMIGRELGLWKNLQVYADKRTVKALPAKVGILDCKHLWEDVEQQLFISNQTSHAKANKKQYHLIDQKVDIVITGQDKENPKLFYCKIDDEIGGEGTIRTNDIVPYGFEPEIRHFRSESGKNLVFEATIVDKEDDTYRFSMIDTVKKWAEKYYGDNELIICQMFADRPANGKGRIPAITKEGISVNLGGFDEAEESDFRRGDIVVAIMQSEGPGTFHINAKVIKHFKGPQFYVSTAFHKLMHDFAYDEEEETMAVEEKDLLQNDKFLDASYVREIIRMIDRMSTIDSEYVNAYNYLGFARTLCLMIGWEEQASYYKGRMQLIVMLHDFAINDVVNQEELDSMERVNADVFKNDATLHSKFLQLQTVSYMGRPEHDSDLWEIYTTQEGLVRNVASLVIAYNMVKSNHMNNLCVDLQNRIKQTLRLKGYESNLKIYGSGIEDNRTEYKTSIVFPPDEGMKPNLPKQMTNILKVIASFLNTYGGTLYIGVNDSGAGVGITNDLEDPYFNGDKDKYQRTILDAVVKAWGKLVATFIDIAFDYENKQKDILVVTVNPYMEGVPLDGKWIVRIGSTKRELTKKEFEDFKGESRMMGLEANNPSTDVESSVPTPEEPQTSDEKTTENKPKTVIPVPAKEQILTSKYRHNTFEEYEEDYRPHIACFKFLDNGKFSKVSSYDYDPCLLTLAVYDEETRAFLVLGYEDGTVAKVPVEQLLRFEDYREYVRNTKAKLLFASIANDNDALVTVSHESKNKNRLMIRMDTIDTIEADSLTSTGERLYKEGMGEVVAYEVVPNGQFDGTEVLINKGPRTLGISLTGLSPDLRSRLSQWYSMP